ncbi:FAD-binding oxidoreductase [Novosphingobium sp. Gsoil 351]|uniref:FAD-binding oxidoreductase n=1 Tax=Novosphingobium sp. Gsoil 351 TaxID=2675225 RepID=UPI0012B4B6EC|nr:FAD-binding protein [Novosphingobium sp. Gsoil 351]QGN54029.1 FAD-binding protein [Novosphingobium sp. Gsoil 351]
MTDQARQTAALSAIEASLGAAAVDRSPQTLARYATVGASPIGIVLPADEAQLAKALELVSGAGGVLQPVCNGAYGLEKAGLDKVIVLDLQRMNQILEVNGELAYCLVEPGVTFRQLDAHIRGKGIKLWVDHSGNPDASVAASFVGRHPGYTPYSDHFLMQCGLEVMLADGKLVRTGMGAMPKSTCWQLFKFGYGPWVDGLFTQSDFAVPTKVGMWMMPEPPAHQTFMVSVPDEDGLAALFDVLGPLKLNMVVANGVAVSNALHEAALLGRKRSDFEGQGPMAANAVKAAGEALGLGYWNLYGALYGLPGNVPILWNMVKGAFSSIPGARVITDGKGIDPRLWAWRMGTMTGTVASAPANVASWNGDQLLTANPVSPVDGEEAMRLYELSRDVCAKSGFDLVSEAVAIWRSANHRQVLPFASSEGDSAARARGCAEALIAAQAEAGFGQIIAEPGLRAAVDKTFGSEGLSALHARVKIALDPTSLFTSA